MVGCLQSKITWFIFLLFCFSQCKNNQKAPQEPYLLTQEDKALLQNGDIILRKGEGLLSQFICDRLNDSINISHCGILVKQKDELNVIHALSKDVSEIDGVQSCSFDRFTRESVKGSLLVVRYRNDTAQILASQALYYLQAQKPFDRLFDMHDSSSFFCSELPLHILKYNLHNELMHGTPSFPRFSLFLNPQEFDIIYPRH